MKASKRIPNLVNVKIYVAGDLDNNAKLQGQVREFWAKFFKKANADYSPDRYGADLIAFPECGECKQRYSKSEYIRAMTYRRSE